MLFLLVLVYSYPYPVERTIAQLELSPVLVIKSIFGMDQVTQFHMVVHLYLDRVSDKMDNDSAVVGVGQGFWYSTAAPQTWVVNKPF